MAIQNFAKFAEQPTPRMVTEVPDKLLRWPGKRANWFAGFLFPTLATATMVKDLRVVATTGLLVLAANAYARFQHWRKTTPLLRHGKWCIAATISLTQKATSFRYRAPDGRAYEATIKFWEDSVYSPDEQTPTRVNLLLDPNDPSVGAAYIPGEGLRHFVAQTVASIQDDATLTHATAEFETVIKDSFARRTVKNVGWAATFFVGGPIYALAIALAFVGVLMGILMGGVQFYYGAFRDGLLFLAMALTSGAFLYFGTKAVDKWLRPNTVSFGEDGVLVGDRFISFDEIDAVQGDKIRLHDGEIVHSINDGQLIRELHRDYRQAEARPLPDTLSRRGQRFLPWSKQLSVVLRAGGQLDYRGEALTEDDLWAVAESPRASHDERVGAAVALAEQGDKQRLRIEALAERTASPKLKQAFVLSAEHELEALAEAVQALDEEHADTDRSARS